MRACRQRQPRTSHKSAWPWAVAASTVDFSAGITSEVVVAPDEVTSGGTASRSRTLARVSLLIAALAAAAVYWFVVDGALADPLVAPTPDNATTPRSLASAERGTQHPSGTTVHVVGRDIVPGTYRSSGNSSCHWVRLSGATGSPGDIALAERFPGSREITIEPTDVAFAVTGCHALHRMAAAASAMPGPARESFPP
jgi:hypothetical protein